MQVKKQQLKLDIEQQTGSKLGAPSSCENTGGHNKPLYAHTYSNEERDKSNKTKVASG